MEYKGPGLNASSGLHLFFMYSYKNNRQKLYAFC